MSQDTLEPSQMSSHMSGFTLVEVLVTLVVFSILSVAAITILGQGIAAKDRVDRVNETVEQLRRSHALLKADLSQLVNRPTRDGFGARRSSVFSGGMSAGNEPLLRFVRDGWANPSGQERRSSLQRVEYVIEGKNLIRRSYYHPDSASNEQGLDLMVLSNVEDVQLSFFMQGQWYEVWSVGRNSRSALPAAVAFDIKTVELGRVRQVFLASELSL